VTYCVTIEGKRNVMTKAKVLLLNGIIDIDGGIDCYYWLMTMA